MARRLCFEVEHARCFAPCGAGIGFNPTAAHDAAQAEIREMQKAKAEERDRKLQQKVEISFMNVK